MNLWQSSSGEMQIIFRRHSLSRFLLHSLKSFHKTTLRHYTTLVTRGSEKVQIVNRAHLGHMSNGHCPLGGQTRRKRMFSDADDDAFNLIGNYD